MKYESAEATSNIFIFTPMGGYKFIFDDSFLLELSGGYQFSFGTINLPNDVDYNYNFGGFVYGVAFGWGWD